MAAHDLAPVDDHFIAGLDIAVERRGAQLVARLLVGRGGRVDAALLSLVTDVVGGHLGLAAGQPGGISTTDITVHGLHNLRGPGELVATAELLALSRHRACVRVDLVMAGGGRARATATGAFRLWPGAAMDIGDPDSWETGTATASLERPLAEVVGVEVDPGAQSAAVHLRPQIANHVRSLQGGATVALLEAAARTTYRGGEVPRTITTTYLAQGRIGPIRAAAERPGGAHAPIEVTAVDLGDGDRPVAHAVVDAAPPPPLSPSPT